MGAPYGRSDVARQTRRRARATRRAQRRPPARRQVGQSQRVSAGQDDLGCPGAGPSGDGCGFAVAREVLGAGGSLTIDLARLPRGRCRLGSIGARACETSSAFCSQKYSRSQATSLLSAMGWRYQQTRCDLVFPRVPSCSETPGKGCLEIRPCLKTGRGAGWETGDNAAKAPILPRICPRFVPAKGRKGQSR